MDSTLAGMEFLGTGTAIPEFRPPTAWSEHGPFAIWLVRLIRPKRIVELGSHFGYSYFSFCQAVLNAGLDTDCIAVDTWSGDEHSGFYDGTVYESVLEQNRRYAHFSRLLRKTFDAALPDIEDGTVDLLHIDGRHFYEDVKADFEAWVPKLSRRSIVIFHDTEVRERGFGVHKFWSELSATYASINFRHGYGLGILLWGEDIPDSVRSAFFPDCSETPAPYIEEYFRVLGQLVTQYYFRDEITEQFKISEKGKRNAEARSIENQVLLQTTSEEAAALREELSERDTQLTSLGEAVSRQDNSTREMIASITEFGERMSEVRSRLEQSDLRVSQLETTIDLERETLHEFQEKLDHTSSMMDVIRADFENHNSQTARLRHWASDSEGRLQSLESGLSEQQVMRSDVDRLEATLTELITRYQDQANDTKRNLETLRHNASKTNEELYLATRRQRQSGMTSRLKWISAYISGSRSCRFKDFVLLKRSELFDEDYYRSANPDVAKAGLDPVFHYLKFGAFEDRDPSPQFSEPSYKALHEDVRAAGFPGLLHYERFGRAEGRRFVTRLQALMGVTTAPPSVESREEGERGARNAGRDSAVGSPTVPPISASPNLKELKPLVAAHFDPRWYRDTYPDLRRFSDRQALDHFIRFGSAELRRPSRMFDPVYYLDANPDTRGQNPLAHYLLHGKAEGRQPRIFGIEDLRVRPELQPPVPSGAGSLQAPRVERVCCLVHIYYPDLSDELIEYVNNIAEDKDVYVNLVTTTWTISAHQRILEKCPGAIVIISQDHGRDIGGFARLLSIVDVSKYDIFMFAHSKKSPHLPPEVGEKWRRELLEPIAGTSATATLCLRQMRSNTRMGLVGSAKWRCRDVLANSSKFEQLLDIACVAHDHRQCDFVSGTMFFIAQPIVKRLRTVLRVIVFEDGHNTPLSFHVDGQYAHAVERLIGNLVLDEGMFTWYK